MPTLATLAAFAALFDLFAVRWTPLLWHDVWPADERWMSLPRNLMVVAALAALSLQTASTLRRRDLPTPVRLAIASLMGVFVSAQALLLITPATAVSSGAVWLTAISGAILSLLLLVGAWVSRPSGRWQRVIVVACIAHSASWLAWLVAVCFEPLTLATFGVGTALLWLIRSGELAYLTLPFVVLHALAKNPRPLARRQRHLMLAAAGAALAAACIAWWSNPSAYVHALETLHFETWRRSLPGLYAILFAAAVAVGCLAWTAASNSSWAAGTAMMLLLSAGYATKNAAATAATVLAYALLSDATAAAMRSTPVAMVEDDTA